MTDAEIRKQLGQSIEQEQRGILVESPKDGPPLLIISARRLSSESIHLFRHEWESAWKRDQIGPKSILIDGGMEVFQLLDGEWRKLS